MSEKELDILYNHYCDSFSYLRSYIKNRDNVFYIALAILTFLFFQINNVETTFNISQALINKGIGQVIKFDLNYLNSIFLVLFLSILIKYYQVNLLIERQYDYIHKLEKKLRKKINGFSICRESNAYLDNYPLVLNGIHWIYTIVFPLLVLFWSFMKIRTEYLYFNRDLSFGFFIFDSLIVILISLVTIFYFTWINFKDFKKKKK